MIALYWLLKGTYLGLVQRHARECGRSVVLSFLPPKHAWTFRSEKMMRYPAFDCLRVSAENGVATVTIDNPPINLVDSKFTRDLLKFIAAAKDDEDTKAIVFQ